MDFQDPRADKLRAPMNQSGPSVDASKGMKLSLSGRLWEAPGGYHITLAEQISVARDLGYKGIEVRYPMLPKDEEIKSVRAQLQSADIEAVFCFCAKIPQDAASWSDVMRVVRTIHELGGSMVRVAVKAQNDLLVVRELAQRAGDMGVQVLLHLHLDTLCDTSIRAVSLLDQINHPNIALLLDPAHLAFAGEADLSAAIACLSPQIGLVNIQNYRRTGFTDPPGEVKGYDGSWTRHSPELPGGLDFSVILNRLHRSGYAGWLNVMCPTLEDEDKVAVARSYFDVLAPWCGIPPRIAHS